MWYLKGNVIVNLLIITAVFFSIKGYAQTNQIFFQSGTGSIGSQDSNLWVVGNWEDGPTNPRPGLTGASGFQTPQHPYIVNPYPSWAIPISGGNYVAPGYEQWSLNGNLVDIGWGEPGGWQYYEDFNLPANVSSATLDLLWHGDDGAYPNINGTYIGYGYGTGLNSPPAEDIFNITQYILPGNNRLSLFVENANTGGPNPTGVDFKGILTYTVTPEPSSFILLITGILPLCFLSCKKLLIIKHNNIS